MHYELPVLQPTPAAPPEAQVVEVGFKGNRRGYFSSGDAALKVGEWVVVEVERGQDLGRVRSVGGVAARKCAGCGPRTPTPTEPRADEPVEGEGVLGVSDPAAPASRLLRRAEPGEVQQILTLRADEERVRRKAKEMVEQHGLKMKVTEAEWQWDKNKLTLYFTAERRVDFRLLVRELARTFRTRIELKQIGVRDEAALLGGVGRCGRELCCATWLREIKPISLQLAKDQGLSLNPAQISGTCGRLMCCLTYEHDAYLQAKKRFPREGKLVRTLKGEERVVAIDIWKNTVTLQDEARQRRVVELAALKNETAAAAAQEHPADGNGAAPTDAPADVPRGARPARGPRRDTQEGRNG